MALFSAFLVGHHGFPPKLHFSETPRPIAELQSYVGVFWNFFRRAEIWGRFRRNMGQNGSKSGKRGQKRGQKNFPPKFLPPFLDSKFNVDYEFSIKHDLNPSSDWDLGVQSWGPKRENRQYHTLTPKLYYFAADLSSINVKFSPKIDQKFGTQCKFL